MELSRIQFVQRGVVCVLACASHFRKAGAPLIEKLDFLVRFWELKARNASLGEPLAGSEQIELLSLLQLVTGDLEAPPARAVARPKGALPAQLIGEGTILRVEVRKVSASALLVSCASLVAVGAQFILRAADAVSGVEYALPCKVLWVYRGAPTIVALAVDGIPTRAIFAGIPEPRMSMPLTFGKNERMIG